MGEDLLIPKQGWAVIFLNSFYIGFIILTVICLLLRLFVGKRISEIATNVQYSVNLVFALGIILRVFILAIVIYPASEEGVRDLEESPIDLYPDMATQNDTMLMAGDILLWIIGFLFLFHRLRQSWILSLLALLLMDPAYLFSGFFDIDRGYLPSLWESFHKNEWMIKASQIVFFIIITLLAYLFLYKRKKLPYL